MSWQSKMLKVDSALKFAKTMKGEYIQNKNCLGSFQVIGNYIKLYHWELKNHDGQIDLKFISKERNKIRGKN
jgi:hypothetical protein